MKFGYLVAAFLLLGCTQSSAPLSPPALPIPAPIPIPPPPPPAASIIYWSQALMTPAELYLQLWVFAGSPNCGTGPCPLVQSPTIGGSALSLAWYLNQNPFKGGGVPASTIGPLNGLNVDGMGQVSPNGPVAISTDGNAIGVVISPRTLYAGNEGSVTAVIPQFSLVAPVNPWVDAGSLRVKADINHSFSNVGSGSYDANGALIFYLTFVLDGPNGARIQYVARIYQDKYLPNPEMMDVTDAAILYAGGALISSKLGVTTLNSSCGDGNFSTFPAGRKTYCIQINRGQLAASISFINSTLGLNYSIDYREWTIKYAAIDIESFAAGTSNPQIGLNWSGLELSAVPGV